MLIMRDAGRFNEDNRGVGGVIGLSLFFDIVLFFLCYLTVLILLGLLLEGTGMS